MNSTALSVRSSAKVAKLAAWLFSISIAALSLPAQASFVAEQTQNELAAAGAALRDRLAVTGDPESFVGTELEQTPPDSEAVRPVVALPVPEPETYALLLAGFGVVAEVARRRRARRADQQPADKTATCEDR